MARAAPMPIVALAFRPLDTLIPYARNARTHSDAQVAQLAASIEEFGFAAPILADDKGIVAGHGRVLAARRLVEAGRPLRLPSGDALPAGCVPVVDCSGWSDAKRRAYVLADNRLAENAGWDHDTLAQELKDLAADAFDMARLGFTDEELADLLDRAAFDPGTADGQSRLDQKQQCACPACGHVFTPTFEAPTS